MTVGYDYSIGSHTVCISKSWDSRQVGGAILLYSFGTVMASDAVMDAVVPSLNKVAATLQDHMEKLALGSASDDIFYVTTSFINTCAQLNRDISAICDYVGQGIYVGGVIMYYAGQKYMCIPFGGGRVYTYLDGCLTQLGELTTDPFVRNTLGGTREWECTPLQGSCQDHSRFILSTHTLSDLDKANQIITDTASTVSHPNTVPMLLIRELARSIRQPAAIMDICLS